MMKNSNIYQKILYFGGAVIALAFINIQLFYFNYVINNGRTVLVPLYFAEDKDFHDDGYMKIHYENIIPETNLNRKDEKIVISSDSNKVIIYSRFTDDDLPLEVGEFVIKYKVLQPYAFFNKEGLVRIAFGSEKVYYKDKALIDVFKRAHYAVLKIDEDGNSVLHGLADMNYQNLGKFY